MKDPLVRDVSDTARWVAAYRERETLRPHPLFRDPLAGRLAGPRGRAIAAQATVHSEWALVARTKVLDDMIQRSVAAGADTVLSLAAGFDTRPYRLALPADLTWIEADLPALIAEKDALLQGETPVCRLSRVAVDLADPTARAGFLAAAVGSARRVLVITEGLVMYLEPEVVAALAIALAAQPGVAAWMLDFSSPVILAAIVETMGTTLASAPMKFAPAEGIGFFEAYGWREGETHSLFRAAGQLGRLPSLMLRLVARLPQPNPRSARGRWSVVTRLDRVGGAS